ncbi:MAG: hypothetical protein QF704_12850 [Anaerolineales bacterium]|nr:hypothetical protein [Anaerolineales bacterium]
MGADTFSEKYQKFAFSKIMFAWGNLNQWLIIERDVFEVVVATGNCVSCTIDIFDSSEPDHESDEI